MPDVGGFGRGLLKGALSATEKAAEKVKEAAEAASRQLAGDVEHPDPDATQVVRTTTTTSPARGAPGIEVPPAASQSPASAVPAAPDRTSPDASSPALPAAGNAGSPAAPSLATTAVPSPVSSAPAPEGERPGAGDPGTEDRADTSDVRELVELFQRLLASRRPPAGPVPDEWAIGVGDLLAEHPKVPDRVRGLVTKLNRFGGLAYSPREVTFDGEEVPWEKVTEVRTRHVVDYLAGDAVRQQVENLPVPWFPGRQRLIDALGQALLTVTVATAKNQLDGLDLDLRIPAEIVYKGSFGRSKELGAGVFSALVLADPAVNRSLLATVRDRGITVTAGEDELLDDAGERAEQIREKVKALEAELDRFTKRFGPER